MRASFENIAAQKGALAFHVFRLSMPEFIFHWHYHPEYELTWIVRGEGKRMAGDSIESFRDGDLVLLGSGLPHTWSSEKQARQKKLLESVVIQFPQSLFDGLIGCFEFTAIKKMMQQSSRGLVFSITAELTELLQSLPEKKGAERIAVLILLLEKLTQQKPRVLSSADFTAVKGEENEKRINKVYSYVQQHFTRPVKLEKIAAYIHLSPSAFCKFIKRVSGKTFSDYVNDVRIAHACRLLTETDNTISAIAYASGFESLTYFNRVFLKKKKMTPVKYRKV